MDYIFLIGIVLDTTSDTCIDNVEYKIKGFCLFDYHKQACKFVSIKGYKDWVDYFIGNILDTETSKNLKKQLICLSSPDVSIVPKWAGDWAGRSSLEGIILSIRLSILRTLVLYNSNLKVINIGYSHKCLGKIKIGASLTVLLMLDVNTMKTFEVLYHRGVQYHNVDYVFSTYRRSAIPDIYFDCTELKDIKYYSSVDSKNTSYCVNENVIAFLTDIDTYSAGKEVKKLSIELNLTKDMKSFNLIVSDKLEVFSLDFKGRGIAEYLNFYIPKGFYSAWLVPYVYSELCHTTHYLMDMSKESREYVSKLRDLYFTEKFRDLIALRVANNSLYQRMYAESSLFRRKYNFLYY